MKLILALLISIDVQVGLLDGEAFTGVLQSLDQVSVVLKTDSQVRIIALNQVVFIASETQDPTPPAMVVSEVLLHDGSRIPGEFQALTSQGLSTRFAETSDLKVPRSGIRAVRLQPSNEKWSAEWTAFTKRDNSEDLLILRKRDGTGLDFHEGAISAADGDRIFFVLDGESIPVPRERVYGLVFATAERAARDDIVVEFAKSGTITARQVELNGNQFRVQTSWSQVLAVPLSKVRRIDYSSGRFHYLSDLDPVREAYYGTQPEGSFLEDLLRDEELLGSEAMNLWKLHRDELPMGPFGPQSLTLRGQSYAKGIWLFPRCRIDYALDGRYTTFQSIVGVDDEVAFNCSDGHEPSKVQLRLLADGDEVWDQLIEAPAEPVSINLDVSGKRTLSIEVDFGDGESACDFLDLADARLLVVPHSE